MNYAVENKKPTNWLFRVGKKSAHLWGSCVYNIWGIYSSSAGSKFFFKNAKPGDCLWFVQGNSEGLIVASAIYNYSTKRENGVSMSFEKLWWSNIFESWDIVIYFTNFKKIEKMGLLSNIKGAANPRIYNSNCLVNLPEIYLRLYPNVQAVPIVPDTDVIKVKRITIQGINYLKASNGDVYDVETQDFIGTYIDEVFTRCQQKEDEEETDDDDDTVSIASSEEQQEIVTYDEQQPLSAILDVCLKISNEMFALNLELNSRLSKL